ncbi:hypothetical protein GCM10011391_01080 [Pullulanibacillus camelliae]|uniref:Uncharacterized protein n=1 Tax=Pullulanibacillus camelliae TaxID=1707096 RepID=A0A8J2VJT5_9BACL|nr:hypothetical protein [Pullulanibacillus camelliae]GGE26542.1 hypothetical protein GCM10011391_01080 [Pullulanibacillus camelliae]
MGAFEDLYQRSKIFNQLFGQVTVGIETNLYDESLEDYAVFYVNVANQVDLMNEEITALATSIDATIPTAVFSFFRADIPPQSIKRRMNMELLNEDARELLLIDDWNLEYPDRLFDSVEQNIDCIPVIDEEGKKRYYYIKIRDLFIV